MMVIRTDNYDRAGEQPGRDEKVMEKGFTEEQAKAYAAILNEANKGSDYYFRVVPEDYKLKEFQP